jgi:hypothetical protein
VAVFVATDARAQSRIESIRVGGTAEYDRLVFDLGESVDVGRLSEDGADELLLQLDVRPPLNNAKLDDKLAELGVFVEESDTGSTVRVIRDERSVRVFKLPPAANKSGARMVIDISKGRSRGPFSIPPDAESVPFKGEAGGSKSSPEAEKPRNERRQQVAKNERTTRETKPAREEPREEPREEEKPAPREMEKPARELEKPVEKPAKPSKPDVAARKSAPLPDPGNDPNEIWVTVRTISIEGVGGASPSQDELLALEVEVSPVKDGYVEPRNDLPVERVPLFKLTGEDRAGRKVNGGVLQLIVETIASAYSDLGKLGTRVDIRQSDLEKLIAPGSDGELVIRVQESTARRS